MEILNGVAVYMNLVKSHCCSMPTFIDSWIGENFEKVRKCSKCLNTCYAVVSPIKEEDMKSKVGS
jgi:hypothetical protein